MAAAPTQDRLRLAGFGFNVACALYFVTLGPVVAATSRSVARDDAAFAPWLGVLLLALVAVETWALPRKMAIVRASLPDKEAGAGFSFLLWILHSCVAILVLFLAIGSFGFDIGKAADGEAPLWVSLTIPAIVIKELYLLFKMTGWGEAPTEPTSEPSAALANEAEAGAGAGAADDAPPEDGEVPPPCPRALEPVLDGILLLNACAVYSATWGAFVPERGIGAGGDHVVMLISNTLAGAILFAALYLPLRIPYWTEELVKAERERFGWAKAVLSFLSMLIPALIFL